MRLLLVLVGVAGIGIVAPSAVSADPAFLGIGLDPMSNDGCRVTDVTANSAAQLAGFTFGDLVVGFAGAEIADCKALLSEIANRAPGDDVRVDVLRMGAKRERGDLRAFEPTPISVTLTSRADVTRRRMLGRKLVLPLVGSDDGYALETATFDRTTLVVVASSSCVDCAYVSSAIAHRLRNRVDLALLAVVPAVPSPGPGSAGPGAQTQVKSQQLANQRFDAPLAVTMPNFIRDNLVDDPRAYVMIVDRDATVVQILTVSNEQSLKEFIDGLVDEAEQTEHQGRR